eukprot:CAMPEP_0170553098 /NCGR_PEP_ID=MMETSP0211-20121228/10943_1 /TAXON_ID=311385 /ORGANISM="Pseudokeronopsis sp., Strain OXSARD2" /LENGTH=75 /DNA_ID=CAMNT_0010861227 /DNA_START=1771 /DNA_END=1998 /DNA_ORIENTATION=-
MVDTPTRIINQSNEFIPFKGKTVPKTKSKSMIAKTDENELSEGNLSSGRKKELKKKNTLIEIIDQDNNINVAEIG